MRGLNKITLTNNASALRLISRIDAGIIQQADVDRRRHAQCRTTWIARYDSSRFSASVSVPPIRLRCLDCCCSRSDWRRTRQACAASAAHHRLRADGMLLGASGFGLLDDKLIARPGSSSISRWVSFCSNSGAGSMSPGLKRTAGCWPPACWKARCHSPLSILRWFISTSNLICRGGRRDRRVHFAGGGDAGCPGAARRRPGHERALNLVAINSVIAFV